MKNIRVRFAPSPTGNLHIGSARTALFNYIFAKQNKGELILRVEDTDKERSTMEYEKNILSGLRWLGITHSEFYRQSERGEMYKKFLREMLEKGTAFEAEENKEGTGKVIRFKNPNKEVVFKDIIRGDIKFDTTELGDFVIAKDLESPLYHLAVVVDDFQMDISHIIRGEDGISNTPRQILIQEAIGAQRPQYAHIPLILAPDRSKMSKRYGSVSIDEYKEKGYLPEALINFLSFLGWNPGDDKEILSLEEIIESFNLEKVQKGGAIFNIDKLNWINSQYIKKISDENFFEIIWKVFKENKKEDKKIVKKIIPIIKERVETISDIEKDIKEGEYNYFFQRPQIDESKIKWKENTLDNAKKHLRFISTVLEKLQNKEISSQDIKSKLWDYAEKEGKGNVLWPLRYVLSGRDKSPDPFTLISILGVEQSLARIKAVL